MQVSPIANANPNAFVEGVECNLPTLEDGQKRQPTHGVLRILNQADGDKRVTWDRGELSEINDAKRTFDSLVEQGFVPYAVDAAGKQTTRIMEEFDPRAEEIIFVPVKQMVGG